MASPLQRYAAPFGYRDYRLMVVAFLIDSLGSWASGVVLDVYVFETTRSFPLLAAIAAAGWVPGLLLAPVGGIIADRFDRRTVMTVSALASGVVAVLVVVLVATRGPIGLLLLLTALSAAVRCPYRPAAGALTPEVVDEQSLPTANSLFASLENLVVVIGPVIGGLLALLHRPAIGLGLNAVSYFVAAGITWVLRVRSRGGAGGGVHLVRELSDGVRALAEAPTALPLVVFAALDTLLAGAYTVIYFPISERLGLGTSGYGYLLTAVAAGATAGAVLAERLSSRSRLAPIIVGGLLLQALPYALTAFTDDAAIGLLLQAASGAGMVFVDVLALTAIQREVATGQLSRVLSLLDAAMLLASVLGTFGTSGLLALPYEAALISLGLGIAAIGLLLSPLLVRADRRAAARAGTVRARADVLAQVELFRDSPRPVLERLAGVLTPEAVPAGTVVIREGDAADALWVLERGVLAVAATTADSIPDVTAPDVVGELGVLRRSPRTATVTARTDAELWRITADDYLAGVEPERLPLLLLGTPSLRLARTHTQPVAGRA